MPRSYAEGTTVSVDRSRAELEQLVRKHGGTAFFAGWQAGTGYGVTFEVRNKRVRFLVRPPTPDELPALRQAARARRRQVRDEGVLIDEELKRRYRELVLLVKAKLVAVAGNIAQFEEEFLPYFVLPGGQTVAERLLPDLDRAAQTGRLPPLLPDQRSEP